MNQDFNYSKTFQLEEDTTNYIHLGTQGVKSITVDGMNFLTIEKEAVEQLISKAFYEVNHFLRKSHLEQLSSILRDEEASSNDIFVAEELLKNAYIASQGIMPSCQDTGTAIIMGKKGDKVLTFFDDEKVISKGVFDAYTKYNLRYSQLAPLSMYQEQNTGNNLPAQIDLYSTKSDSYEFLILAKGGGSANKTYLYQENKSLLNKESLTEFIKEKAMSLGTAACPPYHLAIVIGGTSAETNLKTVKLASAHYYDSLPTTGDTSGRAFRDIELEQEILEMTRTFGIGAQFGGKYFCHDVRVIRLSRHGASCPVSIAVSCSADRNIKAKITKEGIFLEQLEHNIEPYLFNIKESTQQAKINLNLNDSMQENLAKLNNNNELLTRVSLSGPLIVARDIAHAKLKEHLQNTGDLPQYLKDYPIYYAGPAKTPTGYASGSFGPTTAQRMDNYVDLFQEHEASLIMLAKGNRSKKVSEACKKHGGFYLGSIGGPAARLGKDCIKKVEVLAYEELGMEAIWKIEVENFPCFIIINNKGEDFFNK